MSVKSIDVPDQASSCFELIVPSHLLEPTGSGVLLRRALRTIPDEFKIREDRWQIWVLPAVHHLLDYHVMRIGPTFAFVLGCPAECDHGLPPGPMCVLFQGVSATSNEETTDKG